MPDRSQFEPAAVGSLLADMFILNIKDREEASYRLAGTRLCALYNIDLKGIPFALPWLGNDRNACNDMVSTLGIEKNAIVIGSVATSKREKTVHLETLVLPMMHVGEPNKRVMGLTVPLERTIWLGSDPISSQSITSIRILRPAEKNSFLAETSIAFLQNSREPSPDSRFVSNGVGIVETTPPMTGPDILKSSSNSEPPRRVAHLTVIEGGQVKNDGN